MLTHKRKRRAARVTGKAFAPQAPVVLLLPRHPDDLQPRRPRAPAALRPPPARPTRPPALSARPPAAERAASVGKRSTLAAPARRLASAPPHDGERPAKCLDGKKPSGAGSRSVGRSTPEGGSLPTRRRSKSREAPRSRETGRSQSRFLVGRPTGLSASSPVPKLARAATRLPLAPDSPVSKRPRRTPEASTPPVHPSNPCRSVRRVWVKARTVSRSKAYAKWRHGGFRGEFGFSAAVFSVRNGSRRSRRSRPRTDRRLLWASTRC